MAEPPQANGRSARDTIDDLVPGSGYAGDRFKLVESLGDGTFGRVFKAHDNLLDQMVALKVLKDDWVDNRDVIERFEREIRAAARLKHTGIVQILATGTDPATRSPFYAMELVEGVSMLRLPRDLQTILEFFDKFLAALAYAHAHGVIHRDLKPENILAVKGEQGWDCKILDFGIARMEEQSTQMTATGFLLGTPDYMSPEQAAGEAIAVGPASDLYSSGVLLYELLTGKPPYDGDPIEIVRAHTTQPHPEIVPLEEYGKVPDELIRLIETMMRKRYSERPESAAVVREQLAGILARFPRTAATQRFEAVLNLGAPTDRPLISQDSVEIGALLVIDPDGVVRTDSQEVWLGPARTRLTTEALQAIVPILKLRDPIPSGRSVEKAALWEAVQEASYKKRPKSLIISGQSGMGKSRLARWLVEMLHEHRPMRHFRVVVSNHHDLPMAMHNAIYRYLRFPKLERRWIKQRLAESLPNLDPELSRRVTEFLLAQFTSRASFVTGKVQPVVDKWSGLWTDFVRHLTLNPTPRPLMVWIDGPNDGLNPRALTSWIRDFVQRAEEENWPLLTVWSVQTPPKPAPLQRAVAEMAEMDSFQHLPLAPLSDPEQAALARQFLPHISPELIETLCRLAKGVPLFARELLLNWMESGQLVNGPSGLVLEETSAGLMPEGLEDLVSNRLAMFIKGRKDPDRVYGALMQLACMGGLLPAGQLQVLLEGQGTDITELLRESIIEQHPAARMPEFGFATELMKEILVRRAQTLGLENKLRRRAVGVRIAGALSSMLAADWEAAERYLALAVQLLDDLGVPQNDIRRLDILNTSAVIATRQRESESLLKIASALSERSFTVDDGVLADRFTAAAELWRGLGNIFAGDHQVGNRHCRNAYALATVSNDDCLRVWSLYGQGAAARKAQKLQRALSILRNADATGRRLRDDEAPVEIRNLLDLALATIDRESTVIARQMVA